MDNISRILKIIQNDEARKNVNFSLLTQILRSPFSASIYADPHLFEQFLVSLISLIDDKVLSPSQVSTLFIFVNNKAFEALPGAAGIHHYQQWLIKLSEITQQVI